MRCIVITCVENDSGDNNDVYFHKNVCCVIYFSSFCLLAQLSDFPCGSHNPPIVQAAVINDLKSVIAFLKIGN